MFEELYIGDNDGDLIEWSLSKKQGHYKKYIREDVHEDKLQELQDKIDKMQHIALKNNHLLCCQQIYLIGQKDES